jgi:dienelactone hydrolase
MKKLLGIVVLGMLWCNILIAEEYPNSWKLDIYCKQQSNEWHESAFVVNVENNEFSLGPFNRWNKKNFVFKGKIENDKINITEKLTFKSGDRETIKYSGEFINDHEATLKGGTPSWSPPWRCKGRFFKVDRPPHFTPLKYLSEATEEIIKFTSYNPGIPLTIINGSYINSPVEVSGKLILPKEGNNLPVVVTVHSSGGPSEFNDVTQSWRNDFKNQLLKNNIGIFEIDNFTSRGATETASNQGKVSINAGELDALVAYKILDKHPRVNAKKLGITGLSRGGNAANMAVEKKFSDVVLGKENYYLASLPMASDCFNVAFENPTPTPAKILFLLGGADDYTLAKFCVAYAEKMKKAGGDVEMIVKEGWHHDFYNDQPAVRCPKCVHFNKCEIHAPQGWMMNDEGFISESQSQYEVFQKVFKIDLKKLRKKFEKASTKPGASNKLYRKLYTKMYKKCGERGTTVGGDHGKETVDIAVPFFVNALK